MSQETIHTHMKVFLLLITVAMAACRYANIPSDNNNIASDTSIFLGTINKDTSIQVTRSSLHEGKKKEYVSIDSVYIDPGVTLYKLLFHSDSKVYEVYRVENQDNSIDIVMSFSINTEENRYDCYEVVDLPTGITWNILYNKLDHSFFITDKYDREALGDTIERSSVNFKLQTVTIVSEVHENRYKVNLKPIWPK